MQCHTITLRKVSTVLRSYLHHVFQLFHSPAIVLHSVVGSVHSWLFHVLRLLRGPMQNQLPAQDLPLILHPP